MGFLANLLLSSINGLFTQSAGIEDGVKGVKGVKGVNGEGRADGEADDNDCVADLENFEDNSLSSN